ncbi:hypothetical protein [Hymenobacter sp. CRA2]|uniref:hypothetical protein n=1 Tax=Hymenobacter sp. CRA2 TaxID=1955620 RepID=UPI00098EC5F1|nr:hypothetical protein [Hymenobacter sp. CRA2]OON69818.1 hypothetical protein B0919_07790 [Hymenobacter sp. CRA2]
MRTNLYLCASIFTASIGAPVVSQAQASQELADPTSAATTPAPAFTSTSLVKLGTGLTRGLTIGGYRGTALPVVLGVERQLTPAWAAYANVSSAWRVGARTAAPEAGRNAIVTELGVDAGARYYYHQEKRRAEGRAHGPFVGNYLAAQATTSFTPFYAPRLHHEVTALSVLWGTQHRVGGHGLLDAYLGAGLETRRMGLTSYQGLRLAPHLEAGIKISLVH